MKTTKQTFAAWGKALVSVIKASGAPGALDLLAECRRTVIERVTEYRAAIASGTATYPNAVEHAALIDEIVGALTSDEASRKDVRVMVTSGKQWGLNLISPSEARREQAETSRDKQTARKAKAKSDRAKAKTEGGKDRESQMIALAVTNARRRGVAVAAIVAALDSLK